MFKLCYSKRFKKDFRKVSKNPNFDSEKLENILDLLVKKGTLGEMYQKHKLKGEFKDCFECHLEFDLLIIYKIDEKIGLVRLLRIGSHTDLFG